MGRYPVDFLKVGAYSFDVEGTTDTEDKAYTCWISKNGKALYKEDGTQARKEFKKSSYNEKYFKNFARKFANDEEYRKTYIGNVEENIENEKKKLKQENEDLKAEIERLNKYIAELEEKVSRKNAGRKPKFTDIEKQSMRMMQLQGKSMRKIAEHFGCSVGIVHKILNEREQSRKLSNREILENKIKALELSSGCYDKLIDELSQNDLNQVIAALREESTDIDVEINKKPYVVELSTVDGEVDFSIISKAEYIIRYGEDRWLED